MGVLIPVAHAGMGFGYVVYIYPKPHRGRYMWISVSQLILTQWLNRYLQFVIIMNRSDDSIYNLNYPGIDKVLKSLAARLQVDSKYNRDHTDDISKNSSYSRGMFDDLFIYGTLHGQINKHIHSNDYV